MSLSHALSFGRFNRMHFNYGRGAFDLHRSRARRGERTLRIEPVRFYYGLVTYPLRRTRGWRELFLALRERGVRLALASSAKGVELERYKEIAGIADLIHEETSRDDAAKSKPDPDIFLAALNRLGQVNPAHTRVIGDTPYDAMAARPINAPCIGVLCGGWSEHELREAGCVAVYGDPSELLTRLDEWAR